MFQSRGKCCLWTLVFHSQFTRFASYFAFSLNRPSLKHILWTKKLSDSVCPIIIWTSFFASLGVILFINLFKLFKLFLNFRRESRRVEGIVESSISHRTRCSYKLEWYGVDLVLFISRIKNSSWRPSCIINWGNVHFDLYILIFILF